MSTATDERQTVPPPESLADRYDAVQTRIREAAVRSGRGESEIVLVAVTKNASIEQIRELIRLGHVDLGENRVQVLSQHAAQIEEYLQRHHELHRPAPGTPRSASSKPTLPREVRWHMIGHLQRNKVRRVVPIARLIHSVDSLRLAEELQAAAAARLDAPIEVLVQVNVSGEKQKSGIAPAATRHLIEQIDTMFNVKVRGLMCIAALGASAEEARPTFERCRELFDDVVRDGIAGERFNILSMGMSGDFEVAIECGANIVRVGSSIFGAPAADAVE